MEGKSKANKTVTTYENNKKEQLFDSFAILQTLLLIAQMKSSLHHSLRIIKPKDILLLSWIKSKQAKNPYH